MQYHAPYRLYETSERLQDGDGDELDFGGRVAPLRHLVNVAATYTTQNSLAHTRLRPLSADVIINHFCQYLENISIQHARQRTTLCCDLRCVALRYGTVSSVNAALAG